MSAPVLSWLFHALRHSIATFLPFPDSLSASPVAQEHRLAIPSTLGVSGPTLRANPYPEVTDLFCRLPLSTLFYRLEAAHLGDLRRLWVRPGVRINHAIGFSRAVKSAPDGTKEYRFASEKTISPVNPIPWSFQLLKRKENSFQGFCQRHRLHLCYHSLSTSWFGNINPIPFR